MYLLPWQIFAMGCVCGVLITVLILIAIIAKFISNRGVVVEKVKEEDKDDGRE